MASQPTKRPAFASTMEPTQIVMVVHLDGELALHLAVPVSERCLIAVAGLALDYVAACADELLERHDALLRRVAHTPLLGVFLGPGNRVHRGRAVPHFVTTVLALVSIPVLAGFVGTVM